MRTRHWAHAARLTIIKGKARMECACGASSPKGTIEEAEQAIREHQRTYLREYEKRERR